MRKQATEALLRIAITDEDSDVRAAAASALGLIDDLEITVQIERQTEADDGQRALEALFSMQTERSTAALVRLMISTTDEQLRGEIQQRLLELDNGVVASHLVPLLDDRQRGKIALDLLRRLNPKQVANALGDAVEESDKQGSEEAIKLLGQLDDPTADERLKDLLHNGTPSWVRSRAVAAIGQYGSRREDIELLGRRLADDAVAVRTRALVAIAQIYARNFIGRLPKPLKRIAVLVGGLLIVVLLTFLLTQIQWYAGHWERFEGLYGGDISALA